MTVAPHLQRVSDAVARAANEHRHHIVMSDALVYETSDIAREHTLRRLTIKDRDPSKVVPVLWDHVKTDFWMRKNKPQFAKSPAYRFTILAALIGERRRYALSKIAIRFAPQHLQAAE